MMASPNPVFRACAAITSDSKALSRQPKVTISVIAPESWQIAGEADCDRPGHQYVAVAQPLDVKLAAVGDHGCLASDQSAPAGGDHGGAGAAAAGAGDPGP